MEDKRFNRQACWLSEDIWMSTVLQNCAHTPWHICSQRLLCQTMSPSWMLIEKLTQWIDTSLDFALSFQLQKLSRDLLWNSDSEQVTVAAVLHKHKSLICYCVVLFCPRYLQWGCVAAQRQWPDSNSTRRIATNLWKISCRDMARKNIWSALPTKNFSSKPCIRSGSQNFRIGLCCACWGLICRHSWPR